MTKLGQSLLIVVAIVVAAYLWRAEGIRTAVRDAKLSERKATLDSLAGVTDTLYADSLRRLQDSLASSETKVRKAKIEVARLRSKVPQHDTFVVTQQDTLVVVRDSVIAEQDSLISGLEGQVNLWKAIAQAKDSVNRSLVAERDRYRALAEDLNSLAHPGLLSRVSRGVPYLLAGAVLWEAVR